MCKSYHSTGFCPYGTRCHFIHNAEDIEKDSSEEDSLDVKPFEGLKIRYVGRKLSRPCLRTSWDEDRPRMTCPVLRTPALNPSP